MKATIIAYHSAKVAYVAIPPIYWDTIIFASHFILHGPFQFEKYGSLFTKIHFALYECCNRH
jgi:hypothetical protein